MRKQFFCLSFFVVFCQFIYAQEWTMKTAPLMTSWSENIDPENVLPEYPRPQMERAEWFNLNGIWDLVKVNTSADNYQADRVYDKKILAPFPVESAISGVRDVDKGNSNKNYWYKRTFSIPASYGGKDILLHFGGVDWQCKVYVNGIEAGIHEGGYDSFTFNITDYLNDTGEQELTVRVYDPTNKGGQPTGKQMLNPSGIFYTPVTGIWQTVWLEPVSKNHIDDFSMIPDIDNHAVRVTVSASQPTTNTSVGIKIFEEQKLVLETEIPLNTGNNLTLANPKLWSPDSPFLYDMEITLKEGNTIVDEVKTYFGMRKIRVEKQNGTPRIFLNNKPVFQQGVLDQGWWPDGLYTAPSDEALQFDLIKIKELGFNMVRKHVKTEPARWYYHCDRLGLLVWQDIPNVNWENIISDTHEWEKDNFLREMKNIMTGLKNVPSIIMWVVFNEGWGQYNKEDQIQYREEWSRRAIQEAIDLDSSRLINGASGFYDYEIGDIMDKHAYPLPKVPVNSVRNRASVCGEYGGISLKINGHIWGGSQVNYISISDSEELTDLFTNYAGMVQFFKRDELCAAVYTQITDVENEINGLITYDRKVLKFNPEQLLRVNKRITDCIQNEVQSILPSSKLEGQEWRYAFTEYNGWKETGFDDSNWNTGLGGFGNLSTPHTNIRTTWKTDKIYLRKNFHVGDLSEKALAALKLEIYYDEDFVAYINGVKCAEAIGHLMSYTLMDISDEAKAAIKKNSINLITVECKNLFAGQYIDAGLLSMEYYGESTGIKDVPVQSVFGIYPNPVKDYFFVQNAEFLSKIELFSLNGSLLRVYAGGEKSYNLTELPNAVYLLKLYDLKNNCYTQKIIKKK